jgi:hypothetical protein
VTLPRLPKKDPRPVAVTVRLSKRSSEQLRSLAKDHNMSQADVIEHLLKQEYKTFKKRDLKAAEIDDEDY